MMNEQMLKKADKICILAVGTSGDGVSTLLNGLFGEEKCQSRETTDEFTVVVNTYRIRGVVEATVIDCRNLHASLLRIKENVAEVVEAMSPHGSPDLIIYSQKMGENIDADSQRKHSSVIENLTAGFADLSGNRAYKDILWKRCMFVLTFANEYEASLSEQRDKERRFKSRWDEWTKIFKLALNNSKVYVPVKVCIAGFREPKLHSSDHWLSDFWLQTILTLRLSRSGALALIRVNALRFVTAALLSEDLLPSEHLIVIDQSSPVISSVGAAAEIGAAAAASAVTGAAIGGTIGVVGIGVISFGVAAGSRLALGIALGSVVGLAVSSGVYVAIRRYKENKKFRKLPAL